MYGISQLVASNAGSDFIIISTYPVKHMTDVFGMASQPMQSMQTKQRQQPKHSCRVTLSQRFKQRCYLHYDQLKEDQ